MKSMIIATFAVLIAGPALAQDHAGHAMPMSATPATEAFEAANMRMHEDMAIEWSGDADVDFLRAMIPHHQGAVEMAEIALQYAKDPEVRALAEQIIAAQQEEIAWMEKWLAENGN